MPKIERKTKIKQPKSRGRMKRVVLMAFTLCLLLIPSVVAAENDISVLDSSVEIHFPNELVFNLEAESPADIIDARLHYQVDKMNYAQVTSESWADFAPATKIKTSWVWDMRRASLPPGTAITYWWTIEDAEERKLETLKSTAHFDDLR